MSFWTIALLAICGSALIASALFSAIEVAIFSIRGQVLKSLVNQNETKGAWVGEVLAQPRKFLITILFGNAVSSALLVLGLTILCHEYFNSTIQSGLWIPILLTAVLLLLCGELIPKAIASRRAPRIALGMVGLLRSLERNTRPLAGFMDRVAQRWVIRLTPSSITPLHGLTENEYATMLDIGTREGTLHPSERGLIKRTLRLADRNLRDLMTPRMDMCCLDAEQDLETMKASASAMQHRRLPIWSESLDSIVGILNVKRFLSKEDIDMISCIEPPAFVPETIPALELLKNFLRGPQRMAMVVDEFGGVEGLITMEDIIEEVFGEIYDEYDDATPALEEIEPHTFLAHGIAPLPVVSKRLGIKLETDGIDTLGGWLTDRLGALPRVGDRHSFGGYTFRVEKMNQWRVGTVLVQNERRKK